MRVKCSSENSEYGSVVGSGDAHESFRAAEDTPGGESTMQMEDEKLVKARLHSESHVAVHVGTAVVAFTFLVRHVLEAYQRLPVVIVSTCDPNLQGRAGQRANSLVSWHRGSLEPSVLDTSRSVVHSATACWALHTSSLTAHRSLGVLCRASSTVGAWHLCEVGAGSAKARGPGGGMCGFGDLGVGCLFNRCHVATRALE
eukprot:12889426-Alexandrium_andersonii.AAC.1